MNNISFRSNRLRMAAGLFAVAMTIGATSVSAQRFQDVFGLTNVIDAGYHGVKQSAAGGYIAVGESYCCGNLHAAYVVRTNAAGTVLWANSYKFGGIDRATDVIELANGDFVVCGITDGLNNCTQTRDIFIMRINSLGNLIAVQAYGSATSDEEAWKIVEATVGNNVTTNPGDFIVAGSTTNGQAPGVRDGYIIRVNPQTLALIWDAQYGGPSPSRDDFFYGVDEVPSFIGGRGDIVATGGSNSWGAGNLDAFTVRVDGNTGNIGLPPQGASVVGLGLDDEARSIIVLRGGPNAGNLVITGRSKMPVASSTADEVLMVQYNANPCIKVGDLVFGDLLNTLDWGYDLKEDANPVANTTSPVIVTGYTNLGGLGREDVFLQRVNTGCGLSLVGQAMAYGGIGNDEGWSLDNATHTNPATRETPGYVVNGFTQSPNLMTPGDPEQIYQIKTDVNLSSGCNEAPFTFPSVSNVFSITCVTPVISRINRQCTPNNSVGSFISWNQLCYNYPLAHGRGGDGNDGGVENTGGNSHDNATHDNTMHNNTGSAGLPTITFNESGTSVVSYPNPVRSGSPLTVRLNLTSVLVAHVSVSDLLGHSIYDSDVDVLGGAAFHMLSTNGWPAGSYVVHVTYGKQSSESRVVIVER